MLLATCAALSLYSLLSPDIEDDGARDHLVCNDEEWRWRTIQDVCDVILDDAHTVPTPNLQKQKNASFCIIEAVLLCREVN